MLPLPLPQRPTSLEDLISCTRTRNRLRGPTSKDLATLDQQRATGEDVLETPVSEGAALSSTYQHHLLNKLATPDTDSMAGNMSANRRFYKCWTWPSDAPFLAVPNNPNECNLHLRQAPRGDGSIRIFQWRADNWKWIYLGLLKGDALVEFNVQDMQKKNDVRYLLPDGKGFNYQLFWEHLAELAVNLSKEGNESRNESPSKAGDPTTASKLIECRRLRDVAAPKTLVESPLERLTRSAALMEQRATESLIASKKIGQIATGSPHKVGPSDGPTRISQLHGSVPDPVATHSYQSPVSQQASWTDRKSRKEQEARRFELAREQQEDARRELIAQRASLAGHHAETPGSPFDPTLINFQANWKALQGEKKALMAGKGSTEKARFLCPLPSDPFGAKKAQMLMAPEFHPRTLQKAQKSINKPASLTQTSGVIGATTFVSGLSSELSQQDAKFPGQKDVLPSFGTQQDAKFAPAGEHEMGSASLSDVFPASTGNFQGIQLLTANFAEPPLSPFNPHGSNSSFDAVAKNSSPGSFGSFEHPPPPPFPYVAFAKDKKEAMSKHFLGQMQKKLAKYAQESAGFDASKSPIKYLLIDSNPIDDSRTHPIWLKARQKHLGPIGSRRRPNGTLVSASPKLSDPHTPRRGVIGEYSSSRSLGSIVSSGSSKATSSSAGRRRWLPPPPPEPDWSTFVCHKSIYEPQ